MFPKQFQTGSACCKCCGKEATLYGVCDLSKNCEERRGTFLPLSGIPVYYYRCADCGFVFSTQFDDASQEEFKQHIYNEEYIRVDPDYESLRPTANANLIQNTFSQYKENINILDYGGGNGVLENNLRDAGFARVETYDPLSEQFSVRPERKFNLIVSFEVIEHVPQPSATFEDIFSFLSEDEGLLVFSTLVLPIDMDKVNVGWWYISPRNGHISIHSKKSLEMLLRKFGYHLASANQNLHFAFRGIPEFASHLIKAT
jgi:2-polyprenyl-6-hydroxyphenyl methylase/3-demethylubiquinone-9 3-methyltransferase